MTRDTNNDFFTATDLGPLGSASAPEGTFFPISQSGSVNSIDDPADFYRVRLDANSNLDVSLAGVSTGATVELIRNSNNSRFGDRGEIIQTAVASSNGNVSMTIEGLARGDYGVRVATTTGATNYVLGLAATIGAGREQPSASATQPQFLNVLNGTRLIGGSVSAGNDSLDFYRFRVDVPTKLSASLISSADSARFRLDGPSRPFFSEGLSPNLEVLEMDYLPAGQYMVAVAAASGRSTDYTLNLTGTPIERAEMSVFVEQVSTNGDFGDVPDFFARATIDGTSQKTRTVDNRNTVDFNETLTQAVDINKSFIPMTLEVLDSDGGLRGDNDRADLNETPGFRNLTAEYDAIERDLVIFNEGVGIIHRTNKGITTQMTGNGDDRKATTLKFNVNYNSFGFGQTSFSNSTPTTIGSNTSGVTSGRNAGGIVNGRGGNDRVYAKGGNDIAMGGVGNDYVDGGTGDDVVFGGLGRDTCVGGRGRDTFVLAPGMGVDVIKDYRNGDQLGLTNAIVFEMLEISRRGKDTVIGLGGERLAVLQGVRPNQIGAEDFVAIDFINFKGMEVPTLMA